jgi:hypothetical protein
MFQPSWPSSSVWNSLGTYIFHIIIFFLIFCIVNSWLKVTFQIAGVYGSELTYLWEMCIIIRNLQHSTEYGIYSNVTCNSLISANFESHFIVLKGMFCMLQHAPSCTWRSSIPWHAVQHGFVHSGLHSSVIVFWSDSEVMKIWHWEERH